MDLEITVDNIDIDQGIERVQANRSERVPNDCLNEETLEPRKQ